MLQKLIIQNYAIIDELEVDFSGKLNVITGETGAGKSIIVGALALILGERADGGVLVNKDKKCVVEGVFVVKDKIEIREFLEQHEFDADDELIIRREIGTNGKSRAFVNDTPVTLSQLTELSSLLVDLHHQFDTFRLEQHDFQREVLDALAGHQELLNNYREIYTQWLAEKKQLETLWEQKRQFEKEFDYNRFQFDELEEADFKQNELEDLDAELRMLNNAEGIKSALSKLYYDLKESDAPIVQQLKILTNQLQAYSSYHPDLPVLLERLQSSQIELQDMADETERLTDHIVYSPERINQINERLSAGYKLMKKHGAKSTSELLLTKQRLEEKLRAVLNIDEQLKEKELRTEKLNTEAKREAKKISEGRKKQIKPFQEKVNKLLVQVGMPNARLKVDLSENTEHLDLFGCDAIEFLFNANQASAEALQNGQFQPIRKVASGGELSRLMLCIKSLVAESIDLHTMIFDEIDTGISGEAAKQVGIIMKRLAAKRQVICITHQPQIAGKGDAHFLVFKNIINNSVRANIRLLNLDERIIVIARMLGGEKPTEAAMQNAKEMVMS